MGRPANPNRLKTIIGAPVTDDFHDLVRQHCQHLNLPVSEWLRRLMLADINGHAATCDSPGGHHA